MATTAIRNTAFVPANETRGESWFRSIFNAVAHALRPHHSPRDMELVANGNRSELTAYEKGKSDALLTSIIPF